MSLKEAILKYIELTGVVTFILLMGMLDESFPDMKMSEKLQALSELLQSNQIRRYEYQKNDRAGRDSFFMSSNSKLMF